MRESPDSAPTRLREPRLREHGVDRPFTGMHVIEVGGTLAAAGATKTLSDFGAGVTKVEPLAGGQERRLPPFPGDIPHLDRGGFHLALDTGKRSLPLDISTPSGFDVLLALARRSDLVVLHLPTAEARDLIAAVEALGGNAPTTVALSAHGLDGPFAERAENDLSLFAWSNRMLRHSFPGQEPLRYAPHVATMQWAATAAAVAAAALWSHRHGGGRRAIEVGGVESLAGSVDNWFVPWNFTGADIPRTVGPSRVDYPSGYLPCKDGYVMFFAPGEPFFSRLCTAIGHPEVAADPRFTDPEQKPLHFDAFMEYLGPYLRTRTKDEVFTELQAHGVLVAPLLDVSEALRDRQAVARGSFVQVEQPAVGATTIAGPPFRIEGAWEPLPAPTFGQHTVEVLTELGYSAPEQLALFQAGITG